MHPGTQNAKTLAEAAAPSPHEHRILLWLRDSESLKTKKSAHTRTRILVWAFGRYACLKTAKAPARTPLASARALATWWA